MRWYTNIKYLCLWRINKAATVEKAAKFERALRYFASTLPTLRGKSGRLNGTSTRAGYMLTYVPLLQTIVGIHLNATSYAKSCNLLPNYHRYR